MIKKLLKSFLEEVQKGRESMKQRVGCNFVIRMWNEFLVFFEKQRLLAETIAGIIVLSHSTLYFYFRGFVKVCGKFLVLLEKQALVTKAIAKGIGAEYLRLKSSFYKLVQKTIAALIVNRLFIAFARLVQKIFWVCVGISIYAGILIKTQPDGYERVTDVLKRLFPWMW